MLTKETIINSMLNYDGLFNIHTENSVITKTLIRDDMNIEKSGAYYIVSLYDKYSKIHVNTFYLDDYVKELIINNNHLWKKTMKIEKEIQ